jgi:hypothetical protein
MSEYFTAYQTVSLAIFRNMSRIYWLTEISIGSGVQKPLCEKKVLLRNTLYIKDINSL